MGLRTTYFNFNYFRGYSYVVVYTAIPAVLGSTSSSVSRCSIAVVGDSVAVAGDLVVVVAFVVVLHTAVVAFHGAVVVVVPVAVGFRTLAAPAACCIVVAIFGVGVIGVGVIDVVPVICCNAGHQGIGIVAVDLHAMDRFVWLYPGGVCLPPGSELNVALC